jgi:hypothetical protein
MLSKRKQTENFKVRREMQIDAEKQIKAIKQEYEKELNELEHSSSSGTLHSALHQNIIYHLNKTK